MTIKNIERTDVRLSTAIIIAIYAILLVAVWYG